MTVGCVSDTKKACACIHVSVDKNKIATPKSENNNHQ